MKEKREHTGGERSYTRVSSIREQKVLSVPSSAWRVFGGRTSSPRVHHARHRTMATAGGVIAYEDLFEIIDRDADGKKFDKVSRFRCR